MTHDPAYIAQLTQQLRDRPDLLATAEDDLAKARRERTILVGWLHNPAYDLTARTTLAHLLGLPEPQA
ncbi:hypothetical protein [Streptomyces sp. NPDC060243]|uniref:hypothetical protein n=1 Tax=Streptomyces sp. NPDC060243 TaxID=3347081 RepID=UPI00365B3803